jgi:large subunit ribosomal protein L22
MAEAVARARWVRIAPRKVRLVADLVRGKKVEEARDILEFTVKGSAQELRKLLDAAVANAESAAAERRERINADDYVIKQLVVDEGPTMKRVQPRARGRRCLIRKRMSHITLAIGES